MTIAPKTFGQPKVAPEVLLETLFRPMGTDGVYGRTGHYEAIVEALAALISRHRDPGAEIIRLPPVVSRAGTAVSSEAVATLARMRSLLIMIGEDSTSRRWRPTLNSVSLR